MMKMADVFGTYLVRYLIELLLRAVIIMFVAAVIVKRVHVFAAIGYVESLAWSAGVGLIRELCVVSGAKDTS